DRSIPTAFLNASPLTTGGNPTYTFQVIYNDNNAIKNSTIGAGDIVVTASGYKKTATLVSRTPTKNGRSIIATYSIPALSGAWTSADNKTYTVKLQKKQIADAAGLFAAAATLGTFNVNIAAQLAPIPAAPDVSSLLAASQPRPTSFSTMAIVNRSVF